MYLFLFKQKNRKLTYFQTYYNVLKDFVLFSLLIRLASSDAFYEPRYLLKFLIQAISSICKDLFLITVEESNEISRQFWLLFSSYVC